MFSVESFIVVRKFDRRRIELDGVFAIVGG